ncbi:aldo/keto reductase [Streptomyces sp. DH37]|uniref:aldo/keto reductase n=1 Tax=Streptomyces sp. DH37 TaxID=3040122 RepID=UPI002442ECC4|nr:aldo/keto reductase [Streptomyces sp. DH37]MDG9701640.1 hypothetical protein [Streptomyces sp. DH37]
MRTRAPGRTGIRSSPCRLGTVVFGRPGSPDHEDRARTVHRALDAGVNLIGTADVHGYGGTGEITGEAPRAGATTWSSPPRPTA